MCQSRAEGGRRCYSHARASERRAWRVYQDDLANQDKRDAWLEAVDTLAMTPRGNRELHAYATTPEPETGMRPLYSQLIEGAVIAGQKTLEADAHLRAQRRQERAALRVLGRKLTESGPDTLAWTETPADGMRSSHSVIGPFVLVIEGHSDDQWTYAVGRRSGAHPSERSVAWTLPARGLTCPDEQTAKAEAVRVAASLAASGG